MTSDNGTEGGKSGADYQGSLEKILGLGKSLKCTWGVEGTSGTSWVKSGKVYSEMEAQGQISKTIVSDNCMWVWAEGQTQGVKSCYDSFAAMQQASADSNIEASAEQSAGDAGISPQVSYNCQAATVAESKFVPPSGVEFINLNEIVPTGVEGMSQEELEEYQKKLQGSEGE